MFTTTSARSRSRSAPIGDPTASRSVDEDKVPGRWTLDTSFDGRDNTRPLGVIYVITGAGGATLYNIDQQDDPASWQPYTHKFVSRINSLTIADVNGPTLTVRQVSANGQELDRFVVTK